jgi:hypothetical protein
LAGVVESCVALDAPTELIYPTPALALEAQKCVPSSVVTLRKAPEVPVFIAVEVSTEPLATFTKPITRLIVAAVWPLGAAVPRAAL